MTIREFIESHEGGYTEDHAGPTKHGVSFRFLRGLHQDMGDIDGDGDVDHDDIKALTEGQAWGLFVDVIFMPSGIYLTQGRMLDVLMDTAVNMGGNRAVRLLQRVVNKMGARVSVDGLIGPQTIAGLSPLPQHWVVSEYLLERLNEYKRIVEKNDNLEWAYKGWVNRVLNLKKFVDG